MLYDHIHLWLKYPPRSPSQTEQASTKKRKEMASAKIEGLDRDLEKAFDRIRQLEAKSDAQEDTNTNLAKLTVFNTRELARMRGKTDVVCFITGDLKKNLAVAFAEFLKKGKDKRESGAAASAMSDAEPEKSKVLFFKHRNTGFVEHCEILLKCCFSWETFVRYR